MQNDFLTGKNHIKINIHDNSYLIMQIVHYEINIHMDTTGKKKFKIRMIKNGLFFSLLLIQLFVEHVERLLELLILV